MSLDIFKFLKSKQVAEINYGVMPLIDAMQEVIITGKWPP